MKLTFDNKNVRKVEFGKLKPGDCFMTSTVDDDVYMNISPIRAKDGFVNALHLNSSTGETFGVDDKVIPVRTELTVFTR